MHDDLDSRDNRINMGDPIWRMLNGIDRPEDNLPESTSEQGQPGILAIISIGIIPPLILLASEFLF